MGNTPARCGLVAAALLAWVAGVGSGVAAVEVKPRPLARAAADSPFTTLSAADADRYRGIFELERRGDFAGAGKLVGDLGDPVLMGYVEAAKLLHPKAYRASYAELRAWLQKYADHPQADEIRALALKRRTKGAPPPPPTAYDAGRPRLPPAILVTESNPAPRPGLGAADRKRAEQLQAEVKRKLRAGLPDEARKLLTQDSAQKLLSNAELDDLRSDIAAALYFAGDYNGALGIADQAMRSAAQMPLLHWWAGLAAWRVGRLDAAQHHFEALAVAPGVSPWNAAAGAYWAARANLVGHRPDAVNKWLAVGAQYGETFYGILARRALSLDLDYDWAPPPLAPADLAALMAQPIGRRALALLQVGRTEDAEDELMRLSAEETALRPAILAVTSRANLPYLTIRLASATPGSATAARYPTLDWSEEQFRVDRALVLAVVRQESGFNTRAVSPAGARGLMQLMPSTASYIGGEASLKRDGSDRLFDPALNLSLGQRYIAYLLGDEAVGGDLFRFAAAYNAGPGKLRSWQRSVADDGDALLFIESLPSLETRLFIERVLSNLWIYRHRLGQDAPDLDAVAAGDWPRYRELDQRNRLVARHAGN